MRESLLEKLKSKRLSFIKELQKIYNLLSEDYCDAIIKLNFVFKKTDYAMYYEDLNEALVGLFQSRSSCENGFNRLTDMIGVCLACNDGITLDSFLDYLELLFNLCSLYGPKSNITINQVYRIVLNDAEIIGYKFIKIDGYYKIFLSNPVAESVAINQKQSVSSKIYEYLSIRQGDVEGKRKCIKTLADDVEIICKTYSNILEYSKTKQFIQCVRHTKDMPKLEFPFYYENEELWLDKLFELVIGVLSFTKAKGIVSEIISNEKQISDKYSKKK